MLILPSSSIVLTTGEGNPQDHPMHVPKNECPIHLVMFIMSGYSSIVLKLHYDNFLCVRYLLDSL